MAKPRKSTQRQSWKLDPKSVSETCSTGRYCKGKARHSRELDLTDCTITLTHTETGISVSAEIPSGNYSKARMRLLKSNLRESLFSELQDKVAKALSIPGR